MAFENKIIYRRYQIPSMGFYWLIAELGNEKERDLGFGYANLNDDAMAEWGYIDIRELLNNGAELDRSWKPCPYKEAMTRVSEERSE